MLGLGALSFVVPWALLGIVSLPILWWLLRLLPPEPKRLIFPPIRLLFGLSVHEESAARTPPWLILLRVALILSVILGAAHPILNAAGELRSDGPLYLIVDDGWASAHDWPARQAMMTKLIDQAERDARPVAVIPTAARRGRTSEPPVDLLSAGRARKVADSLRPKPWETDHGRVLEILSQAGSTSPLPSGSVSQSPSGSASPLPSDPVSRLPFGNVVWISDGLHDGAQSVFEQSLMELGTLTVARAGGGDARMIVDAPVNDGARLKVPLRRLQGAGERTVRVRALGVGTNDASATLPKGNREPAPPSDSSSETTGGGSELLGNQVARFADGETETHAVFDLPPELRNRLTRFDVEGDRSAASVVLVDERWRRRPVGLIGGSGSSADQPLLSDLYYLGRALESFAEVRQGSVKSLLARDLAVVILADPGPISGVDRQALDDWMDKGGIVLRFAGPTLAQSQSGDKALVPVPLRLGDRVMGGALSWNKPVALAPFAEDSPFHGLKISSDIRVRRQVLARPAIDLDTKTWARLSDETPLVTADRRGRGWLVLVHTTANMDWSNLPLSGLFPEMLRRVVEISRGVVSRPGGPPLSLLQAVDGFGQLGQPEPGTPAIAADQFDGVRAGAIHPPGFYGADGTRRALNLSAGLSVLEPLGPHAAGIETAEFGVSQETDLRPWLLFAAVVLALIDLAASLFLRGLLRLPGAASVVPVVAGLMCAASVLMASAAYAQSPTGRQLGAPSTPTKGPVDKVMDAALKTRLAYMITGDAEVDDISRAGLSGLSLIVNQRTAAEMADPVGVDAEIDELSVYPLIYWPMTASQTLPSDAATSKINAYLKNSGTILFDLRGDSGPGINVLRQLARSLGIPPLIPVPPGHVLTRSYYLMKQFPGRWTGAPVWVEQAGARVNDGVSPVVAGSNDWAAAWAADAAGRPLYAVVPGGARQRELAYRFGINLLMVTLTGNYKADQVHLPSIMERLGK